MADFSEAYKRLNTAQKDAVDSIDGPVMVVAGPGTGKTQVLALRIANILKKTDTPASGIACLTFTNAGVRAMRQRLRDFIGREADEIHVATFHRFSLGLIERHFSLLGFDAVPELLADASAVALADELLETHEWEHIRPRADTARYFGDLKSLISLLKRENITPDEFLTEVTRDIERITNDPDSISSRGARKGQLKMEVLKEIEGLERTREVVKFYELYEQAKAERGLMDYDDVLAYAVRLVQVSEDVRATIRENYLYVLVDEHQDSSGVQNAFLDAVWGDTEQPNIFVVGDDRQLIYGFGGASIEHFTKFRTRFGTAKEITLLANYRSTQTILDAAGSLLSSTLASGALSAESGHAEEKISLSECAYPRDEIIRIAQDIGARIASGVTPESCAILVPKNYQVREAVRVLRDQGIPVAASGAISFFAAPETLTVRNTLAALADPYDAAALAALILDPSLGIPPLAGHAFLRQQSPRKLSLELFRQYAGSHPAKDPLARLGTQLGEFLECAGSLGIHGVIQKIGETYFFDQPREHETFIRQVEVIRTFIHLVTAELSKNPQLTLKEFLDYLDRLENYGHEIPLAVFSAERGVRVLTLHGSKGLEWDHVYIAHLDESSLMKGKRLNFTLPAKVDALIEAKDEMVARRELYVALTRARRTCHLSYSRHAYAGGELEPARILGDLPDNLVERHDLAETEAAILSADPTTFVRRAPSPDAVHVQALAEIVAEEYASVNVSVTLLNNFFECPWKWYFRSLLQVPEAKTESLLLGSVVHTGIEYMLKNRENIDQVQLDAILRECLDREYVSDETMLARTLREAKKILGHFENDYLPSIAADALSERSVTYRDPQLPHLSCYGKIDLSERDGDHVVVTDFKTGSAKTKNTIEKLDDEGRMSGLLRQLAMYSYLLENAEKGTTVVLSKLLFVEEKPGDKDSVYSKRIDPEEIALLKKDIADYDALLSGGEWVNRPCEAVLYGKNKECEYCAKAKALYRI